MKFEELFPRVFDTLKPTMQPDVGRRFHGFSAGGNRRLIDQHLGRWVTPNTSSAIDQLLTGLSEFGLSGGMSVGTQGSLTLNVGGREIAVPTQRIDQTFQMGGSVYAAALNPSRRGSKNQLLNQTQVFVETVLSGLQGRTSPLMPEIGPLQEFSPSAAGQWLQGVSQASRESMKALQLSSGNVDLSRAYFQSNRIAIPVTSLPDPLRRRYTELQKLQRFTSMRGWDPSTGSRVLSYNQWQGNTFQAKSLKLGDNLIGLLSTEQDALTRDIVSHAQGLVPGRKVNTIGLKPGAILPFLRESKGQGAERIYLNTLSPDEIAMFSGYQKLGSGLHQEMKTMVFTREQLGVAGSKMGRLSPVYTKAGYQQQMDFYGRALGEASSDVTSMLPVKLGLVTPGKSQFAHAWLERHLPDSAIITGRHSYVRHAARERWRDRVVKVPARYFRTSGVLSNRLQGLQAGDSLTLAHRGQQMRAADVSADILRNAGGFTDEAFGTGIAARRGMIGATSIPGVRNEFVTLNPDDILQTVTRKGGMFEFRVRQALKPGMEVATPVILASGARRGMLSQVGNLTGAGGADLLMHAGDYGLKFGSEGAATINTYLGHVFSRLDKMGGAGQRATTAFAQRMGLEYGGGNVFASGGAFRDDLFNAIYGTNVATDATRPAGAAKMAMDNLKQVADEAGLTGLERKQFFKAFKVKSHSFSGFMQKYDPAYFKKHQSQLLEADRLGASIPLFEGAPLEIRTIEGLDKAGRSAMKLRLSELQTFQSSFALLPQGSTYRTAYEKLYRSMVPSVSGSAAGSDVAAMFGQFMGDRPGGLRDAPTYKLGQITSQFAPIPEVPSGIGPRVLRPEDMITASAQKPTLMSGSKGGASLRKGGFYLELPEAVKLYLKDTSKGKFGARAAISTNRLYVPGLEMMGKSTWGSQGELYLQQPSRPGGPRRMFGDLEALYRDIYEAASSPNPSMASIQERAQILIDSAQANLPGRDSILRRYFTQDNMLQVAQQRMTLPGAGPNDALTIGLSEDIFAKGGKDLLERARAGQDIFGVTFAYPGFGRPHAQVVKYRMLTPQEIGLKAGERIPKGVMGFGSALSHWTQRDFDWDQAFATIFEKADQTEAARIVYGKEVGAYRETQELLERGQALFEGLGGKDPSARTFRGTWLDEFKGSRAEEVIDRYLAGVRRQKSATPLAHLTFRGQREAINLIGTQHEYLKGLVGDQNLLDAMERVRNITSKEIVEEGGKRVALGTSAADWMYWSWASGVYDVLKKSEAGGALEQFAVNWEQFGDLKHGMTKRTSEASMRRFQDSLIDLYTGGVGLEDVVSGREQARNVVGAMALEQQKGIIKKRLAGADIERKVDAEAVRKHFFEPLSEFLADTQYTTAGLKDIRETSMGSHAPLFGDTNASRSFDDAYGALGHFFRASGIGTDPTWVREEGAMQMFDDIHRQGTMGEFTAQILEQHNMSDGTIPGKSVTADSLAAQGKQIIDDIWKSKVGKVGVIAGAAFMGYQMLKGLVGPEDQPKHGFAGAGSPIPPKPLLETAAHHMQQATPSPQVFPARVQRPEAMRTTANIQVQKNHRSPYMTMGYSSGMPAGMDVRHPETESPEISSWQMQQYMGGLARSSF